ncbi:DUF421 domain-containing protein [Salibacterium qingdaonense]|uniref:Uncharacterized membrane protein YcaP, DUF421 family n=1 Tax=Salibacterium qingdaonense TaxID=266892 RepID=A0A1I4LRB6_9BACI|nr:DUF421 domain-containing protein [Salibacterium qingdaonense]SFL93489.1 Uncharacterized membrane protein YcaP, DUF421 family [Salibacterium qingdaonense]
MNVDVIWESVLLVAAGILILRIAGRKSISQMSLAQTVVMISIGSIIIQPIIEDSLWNTTVATLVFVLMLVFIEYLQLKFNRVERFVTGKAKVIIENGVPQYETLRKMRFTVDTLEMRLRQQGISSIADVKTATLEPNGQLGYELIEDAKPLTVGQFKEMMAGRIELPRESSGPPDVFEEVRKDRHRVSNADNLR